MPAINISADNSSLTHAQLERLMLNQEGLRFCEMHPLAQHCLRILAMIRRTSVEIKTADDVDWRQSSIQPQKMFLEVYRLKPDTYSPKVIEGLTHFHAWNKIQSEEDFVGPFAHG